jgi:hypothetical protein
MSGVRYMKYDYGSDLVLKSEAGKGRACTVVGITPIENFEQAKHFNYPIGTVLYSVEFGDGSDSLTPGDQLSPVKSGS